MYGDHHVVEVRRLLFELDGVDDVYASSGFQAAEITFDPEKVSADDITAKLEQAGYIGDLPIPVEAGEPLYGRNPAGSFYRHTAASGQTANVVGFSQNVGYEGRALWACPGMSPITGMDEDE